MNLICCLTIILPFISFFISFFCGKTIGKIGASVITTASIYVCMICSIYIFLQIMITKEIYLIYVSDWIQTSFISVSWTFYFDALTASMLLVVNIVSFCTHLYSIEYMEGDPYKVRFMSYLSLFTFFMIILITASNLLQLFVGWEGVGICSYLLINFWFHRLEANKAAIMAVITNKVGDITLLLGYCILLYFFKTLDYGILFSLSTNTLFEYNELNIAQLTMNNLDDSFDLILQNESIIKMYHPFVYSSCILFMIGAIGKSAQIGLHIWLPEAMEGPTPVSSLIHAATMVTAGIFLIIRCSFLFETVQEVLLWIVLTGALTSFFASTVACFHEDLKKIIAYSTCSQLGYMFTACGYSAYSNSLFHLFNHAFFKALLFLTAGFIIHSCSDEQDLREVGEQTSLVPFAQLSLNLGSLALTGFPFLSGFYSKEKIIELFYARFSLQWVDLSNLHWMYVAQFLSTSAVIFTIYYSCKIATNLGVSLGEGIKSSYEHFILSTHKQTKQVTTTVYLNIHFFTNGFLITALCILIILSVISGYIFSDMMIGPANQFWNDALYISCQETNYYQLINEKEWLMLNFEFNKYIKGISMITGLYWTIVFLLYLSAWKTYDILTIDLRDYFINYLVEYENEKQLSIWDVNIRTIMTENFIFYNKLILEPLMSLFFKVGLSFYYLLDRGIIELIGPMGTVRQIHQVAYKYEKYQMHQRTTIYLNLFIIGICLLTILLFII